MIWYYDKWIECQKQIKSVHASISRELSDLENPHKQIAEDELDELLKSISSSSFYCCVNHLFNQLAQGFDARATELRREKLINNSQYLPSHHVFLITPQNDDIEKPTSITARMYHSALPPDERLIQIKVGSNALCQRPLLTILHEMGHFLGPRLREERYLNVIRPLVMNAFFQRIFQNTLFVFSGWDENDGKCNFVNEPIIAPDIQIFARQANAILDQAMPEISKHFYKMCDISTNELLKEWRKNGGGEAKTRQDKLYAALDQKFLYSIKGVILGNLRKLVQNPSIFVEHSLMPYIQLADLPNTITIEDMKTYLSHGVEKTAQEIGTGKYTKTPAWYTDCEKELEEPVADIFMLKVSGISTRTYISHLLQLYRSMDQYRVRKQEEYDIATLLLEDISKNENASRIIGIVLARNESADCFDRWYDGIVKHIPWDCKIRQLYRARMCLQKMYLNACICPTEHQQWVYNYIRNVWEDNRYEDVIDQAKHVFVQKQRLLRLRVLRQ